MSSRFRMFLLAVLLLAACRPDSADPAAVFTEDIDDLVQEGLGRETLRFETRDVRGEADAGSHEVAAYAGVSPPSRIPPRGARCAAGLRAIRFADRPGPGRVRR